MEECPPNLSCFEQRTPSSASRAALTDAWLETHHKRMANEIVNLHIYQEKSLGSGRSPVHIARSLEITPAEQQLHLFLQFCSSACALPLSTRTTPARTRLTISKAQEQQAPFPDNPLKGVATCGPAGKPTAHVTDLKGSSSISRVSCRVPTGRDEAMSIVQAARRKARACQAGCTDLMTMQLQCTQPRGRCRRSPAKVSVRRQPGHGKRLGLGHTQGTRAAALSATARYPTTA